MDNPFRWQRPVSGVYFEGQHTLLQQLTQARQASESVLLLGEPRRGKSSIVRCLEETLGAEGWSVTSLEGVRLQSATLADAVSGLRRPLSRTGKRALILDDLERIWRTELVISGAFATHLAELMAEGVWVLLTAQDGATTESQRSSRGLWMQHTLRLQPLEPVCTQKILARGRAQLSSLEREWIVFGCGDEPFFVQGFAGILLGLPPSPRRARTAGAALLSEVDRALASSWRGAPSAERWALMTLALNQMDPGVSVMRAPTLSEPSQQALLSLLCMLSRTELLLAASTVGQKLDPEVRRGEAVGAVLRLMASPSACMAVLSELLTWRPDLVMHIQPLLSARNASLQHMDALLQLQERGITDEQDGVVVIRAWVRAWWILEQLSPVARGDVSVDQWLQGQGLLPPSTAAVRHLKWRISRLEGALGRGARAMMDSAFLSLSLRMA